MTTPAALLLEALKSQGYTSPEEYLKIHKLMPLTAAHLAILFAQHHIELQRHPKIIAKERADQAKMEAATEKQKADLAVASKKVEDARAALDRARRQRYQIENRHQKENEKARADASRKLRVKQLGEIAPVHKLENKLNAIYRRLEKKSQKIRYGR